jgi:hypothetical protein
MLTECDRGREEDCRPECEGAEKNNDFIDEIAGNKEGINHNPHEHNHC